MELQISDIQVAAQIIDLAVQRGAFRAAEAKAVGECYEKINAFLGEVAKQQEAQKAAEAENRLKQAQTELEIAKINAQSNKVLSDSITPQLLQKEALEKWNGQLPMSTSGMPFLDLQTNK